MPARPAIRTLAPDLLKAGHPDLFFELDGQSVAEPKHWQDEEPWSGLREWLTGQAVALREMSWALASDPQNDPHSIARWNGLAWLCATATSAASIPSPVSQPSTLPDRSDFITMQTQADSLARRASTSNWSDGSARALLIALASADGEFTAKGPVLTNSWANARSGSSSPWTGWPTPSSQNRGARLKVDPELNQLFEDVRTLDPFDAGAFASHLRAFRAALQKSG